MTVTVNIGTYRQVVTLANPAAPVPDSDGGFTQTYIAANPAEWRCAIERASVASAERSFASTVIAQATDIFTGRFHAGINTKTRLIWVDRAGVTHTANALDVVDVEGAGVVTMVAAAEVVDASAPVDTNWIQSGFTQ